ncbi:MAG TPA: hypothetical protein VIL94_02290, partial [Acidothermaceae bacterium]
PPPLLLPPVGAGAAGEFSVLRAACIDAVRGVQTAEIGRVMVIGAAGRERGLQGFAPGVDGLPRGELPLSLTIGDWLLDQARVDAPRSFVAVRPDGTPASDADQAAAVHSTAEATALLVMGDGTARRSSKGPGYLDPRAKAFDAHVVTALGAGDAAALAAVDDALAADLLVAGVGAWKAAAAILATEGPWQSRVLFADAPLGVMYVVASWLA